MTGGKNETKALLPANEARELVIKAAEQGVTTPELLGYHILRSAYGALHPEVLAFEQRPKLGQVGTRSMGLPNE
ncbi:hypothetical protein [Cupriavidus taiwanensis]|uniref:Uncharacterized protein n=1 Tax=Cupriavidus taiwanensis TaxID=164546 RepID=A0A375IWR9_9BURK|nr:hypothetical protein [Cupriavidus taiwanensis]SPR97378.1 conserved hypothetical protein [Cupriavidus taiwanensis]